jgi:hypothetical protein
LTSKLPSIIYRAPILNGAGSRKYLKEINVKHSGNCIGIGTTFRPSPFVLLACLRSWHAGKRPSTGHY